MAEEKVFLDADGLKIEALVDDLPGDRGVVVTHPHPLYGGDMHNNVVESVVRAYREKGFSTLRFNFRRAGQSQGTYDNGVGEQKDVASALAYLGTLGKSRIHLAGYSFGAWVNALGLATLAGIDTVVMVSPPVNFMDFAFLKYDSRIRLVIAGSGDDIGPPEMIGEMAPLWNPKAQLEVIQGADHFYWGKTSEITRLIKEFLEIDEGVFQPE